MHDSILQKLEDFAPASEALARHSIPGSVAIAALQRSRVDHVVTVPDRVELALNDRLNQGVDGIRVIDSSIFPAIMGGNTTAPTYMVAAKTGDMIKKDWK